MSLLKKAVQYSRYTCFAMRDSTVGTHRNKCLTLHLSAKHRKKKVLGPCVSVGGGGEREKKTKIHSQSLVAYFVGEKKVWGRRLRLKLRSTLVFPSDSAEMVARTPPKSKKMLAPLNPLLIRETLKKMDQCMARLQELQYTVAGGTKVVSGVNLSPRSTRGYLRTSLRCKQESLRIVNGARSRSPKGKFPANTGGEWKRMSLPAMLVGETLGEILQASQFAREIVSAVSRKTDTEDPKTPVPPQRTGQKLQNPENTQLKARRKREKQTKLESARSESGSPSLGRARSRINFKVSPQKVRELDKENNRYMANRVSPRNRPWGKKAVLFPNPLFLSMPSSQQHKFCKTRSPVISRNRGTPHKFLIKSPPSASKNKSPPSKFQVKIKSPPVLSISSSSPTRPLSPVKKTSPKRSAVSKLRRSFSPSRLASRLVSLSPLKSKRSVSVQRSDGLVMSGLKQRPSSTVQFTAPTI